MSPEQIIVALIGVGYAIVAFACTVMTGIVRMVFRYYTPVKSRH